MHGAGFVSLEDHVYVHGASVLAAWCAKKYCRCSPSQPHLGVAPHFFDIFHDLPHALGASQNRVTTEASNQEFTCASNNLSYQMQTSHQRTAIDSNLTECPEISTYGTTNAI